MITVRWWVSTVVLVCAAGGLVGCSGDETAVGEVTTVVPHLCVGRAAARGTCFTDATVSAVDVPVHVGDCVSMTFDSPDDGPALLKAIAVVSADGHRLDCP